MGKKLLIKQKLPRRMMRRRKYMYALVCVTCFLLYFLLNSEVIVQEQKSLEEIIQRDLEPLKKVIENKLEEANHSCEIPHLIVRAADVMEHIWNTPRIECSGHDMVEINESTVSIRQDKRYQDGKETSCEIREIIRIDDIRNELGRTVILKGNDTFVLKRSDFIEVKCFSGKEQWRNVMAGIRHNAKLLDEVSWDKVPGKGLGLNVLILAFDSVSHVHFERKLPRTLDFLRHTLHVVEFEKYNVLGDGTPHAIIPLLTGKTEEELPETRKRFSTSAHYMNKYPFIWKEFRRNGYVTAFAEDEPEIGMFTYRLKGFNASPTHHYLRPFYLEAQRLYRHNERFCLGAVPRHKIFFEYILKLFRVYQEKPTFTFAFYKEISHDAENFNWLGSIDRDFLRFLRTMFKEGHLERTLLIVMGDHGARFSKIRNTHQGKFEERLPMFAVALSKWFREKYPLMYRSLKKNSKTLTTAFDVHATLKEVLEVDQRRVGRLKERSISLFKDIPSHRTCSDAQIEPHWCTCLNRLELVVDNTIVKRIALFAVSKINLLTDETRYKCRELTLHQIFEAAVLGKNKAVLSFVRSGDEDGRKAFTKKAPLTEVVYQLKFSVSPGDGLYEVSVKHVPDQDMLTLGEDSISRLNAYKPYAKCLTEVELDLGKYCYCGV